MLKKAPKFKQKVQVGPRNSSATFKSTKKDAIKVHSPQKSTHKSTKKVKEKMQIMGLRKVHKIVLPILELEKIVPKSSIP